MSDKKKFAFIENESIDLSQTPSSLEELKLSGRGGSKASNSTKESKQPKASQGKRGRPKSENKDKKHSVVIHLNDKQKEMLMAKAKNANLPMSNYIVIKLFGIE